MCPRACALICLLGTGVLGARVPGGFALTGVARAAGRGAAAAPTRASATRGPVTYAGVSPEAGEPPPQARPAGDLQLITWPGFRSGGAQGDEVFLQLTGAVPYSSRVRGAVVEITLSKVQVALRNNLRRVLTAQFGGVVSSFKLHAQKGHRVRLEIRLARPLTPTITTDQRGAYTFLRVAFPGR